ncbi:MAG TPA: PSD1 and planctomycete cytochrome C domain-containing protein, partial [Gemmataceae bacterium]|nr:PSD1 and planctomycete cytochrome C domain-containing protein [Gemmataceae bacterium]
MKFGRSLLVLIALSPTAFAQERSVDFDRQIRPILSDNCFACHGPDAGQRKAKLRLDSFEGATAKLRRSGQAIVPGNPEISRLIERIASDDPSEVMPPPRTQKHVTPAQLALIRRWIREGARYSEHWAFVAPKRPALPAVKNPAWARNPIDRFILARIEKAGLTPSPEADRVTLIRRLSLDLLGLPPTPAEVDAFVADKAPDAYEKLVDRLFASPHYGERVALDWLDAARFADTHGYHIDAGRDMTRWRDYVIDSFNANLPFDRFTIEQLAGDLLPNATTTQKIASGFNRNHMINFEGGAIAEEYLNAYIVDRVNTTSTVWLGLTVACSQCHDHKYDPIRQKDFYRLYAIFHNVPERGLDGSRGNADPVLRAPTKAQQQELDRIAERLKNLAEMPPRSDAESDNGFGRWEKTALDGGEPVWTTLKPNRATAANGTKLVRRDDDELVAAGPNPATESYTITATVPASKITGLQLEALPTAGKLGRSPNGNSVMTGVSLKVDSKIVPLTDAIATFSQETFPIKSVLDGTGPGWGLFPKVTEPNVAVFRCEPVAAKESVVVTLDFKSKFAEHQLGRFRLAVTDSPRPFGKSTLPGAIVQVLRIPAEKRTSAQRASLRAYYRTDVTVDAQLRAERAELARQKAAIEKAEPTAMIMQEMPQPRDTYILLRGEYDKKGEKVTAGLPSFLPGAATDNKVDRLTLARWLVGPENPLTRRVVVNRYWQMIFGAGLVRTPEDFGSQGEPPTHPELLDWLAVEFAEPTPDGLGARVGWSVRDLLRAIVTSATYRQSSVVRPELFVKDRDNRLLARAPRHRLPAEFIRDQALAASGLLNPEIGGKSVSPYQPAGLWQELASRGDSKNWTAQFFEQSHGKDLYRRTMYTFWKRTSPPPQLVAFDAPDRETCVVRRSQTNTPL